MCKLLMKLQNRISEKIKIKFAENKLNLRGRYTYVIKSKSEAVLQA